MYLENISRYVYAGSKFHEDEKLYRKNSFFPAAWAILGTAIGEGLKSYWGYMSVAMIFISLACVLIVFKLSSYGLTVEDSLWLDVVISGASVLNISILELMYFTMWKGFTPWLLLIYLPVIFIPLYFGIKTYNELKKPDYDPKMISKNSTKTSFFFYGILGANFAAIFRNVDQSEAIIIVLLCCSILNGISSFGLLSLQKLYYMKKYKISI